MGEIIYPVVTFASGTNTWSGLASAQSFTATSLNNSAYGYTAMTLTTGGYNSAFGAASMYNCTSGASNTVMGHNAGSQITTGSRNIFLGRRAGIGILAGSNNIFIRPITGTVSFGDVNDTLVIDGHNTLLPLLKGTFDPTLVGNGVLTINGTLSVTKTLKTGGYTVATLPAGAIGDRAYVTDALAPAWLVAVVGGGAVVTPVFHNGAAWVAG